MKKSIHSFSQCRILFIWCLGLLLVGCQNISSISQSSHALSTTKLTPTVKDAVVIGCDGTYLCEFLSVNDSQLIDEVTHQPISSEVIASRTSDSKQGQPIKPQLVQYATDAIRSSSGQDKTLSRYYVQVPAGQHEILVLFYPENNLQYKERFALIHQFAKGGVYRLHAYRQDKADSSGSLLESASPPPLCVDIVNNSTVEKKFCKQMNELNHDEFSEVAKANRQINN